MQTFPGASVIGIPIGRADRGSAFTTTAIKPPDHPQFGKLRYPSRG
jgi:hypothetical protein